MCKYIPFGNSQCVAHNLILDNDNWTSTTVKANEWIGRQVFCQDEGEYAGALKRSHAVRDKRRSETTWVITMHRTNIDPKSNSLAVCVCVYMCLVEMSNRKHWSRRTSLYSLSCSWAEWYEHNFLAMHASAKGKAKNRLWRILECGRAMNSCGKIPFSQQAIAGDGDNYAITPYSQRSLCGLLSAGSIVERAVARVFVALVRWLFFSPVVHVSVQCYRPVPLQFISREYCDMCLNFVFKYLPLNRVYIRYFFTGSPNARYKSSN